MLVETITPFLAAIDNEPRLAMMGIAAGCFLAWIIFANWSKVAQVREREQTRRELAAYVAEGSILPDDAVKLAGSDDGDFEAEIKSKLAAGIISPKKAEQMLRVACKTVKREMSA
jgi:hypothetical protein